MSMPDTHRVEHSLERFISYLLIVGVIVSVLLEIAGVALYYTTYHTLAISSDPAFKIQGHDFFSYLAGLLGGSAGGPPVQLMTWGIMVLLLTPYLRVVLSVLFFGWEKNWKFVVITLFVLVVLTISLTLH